MPSMMYTKTGRANRQTDRTLLERLRQLFFLFGLAIKHSVISPSSEIKVNMTTDLETKRASQNKPDLFSLIALIDTHTLSSDCPSPPVVICHSSPPHPPALP